MSRRCPITFRPASRGHPAQAPCPGETYSVDIINAAMNLPQWNEMATVVTWDDWGGFYDHVAPPVHKCGNGENFQSGFRVPLILISPYAKSGFVLKTPANQASVPHLVEELWGIPFMTARDPHAIDGTVCRCTSRSARAPDLS
jgi:phospholipase C